MKDNTISIEFLGDLSLDGIYNDPQHHKGLIENMKWINEISSDIDYRVINWESQLWGDGKVNDLKFPRLCTTKDAAQSLASLKLDLALLANNHVYDNHLKGFYNTIDFLKNNKINYIGATERIDEINNPHIFLKEGIKIAIINYVGQETNPKLPKNCPVYLNILEEDKVISTINKLKNKVNHLIVCLHWGEQESSRIPSPEQRELGRKFIDSGASLVIGHHVHCLQGYEKYKKGAICYSIGNFIFGPQLVLPGQIYSNRTNDNNVAALLKVIFTKKDFELSWTYLKRKKNSLFLELDKGNLEKYHNRINKYVYYSNSRLKVAYKIELIMCQIRDFIDKNDGIIKALLSIRIKQLRLLLKEIFK